MKTRTRVGAVLILLLSLQPVWVGAQYAEAFATVVEAPAIDVDQAVWLAATAGGSVPAGTSVEEARTALEGIPVPYPRPGRAVTAGDLAMILHSLHPSQGSFTVGLVPTRHVVLRYLRDLGIVPREWRSGRPLSGRDAVLLVYRYLELVGVLEPAGA